MPELPEVEVTLRGIEGHVVGQVITEIAVRNAKLEALIPPEVCSALAGQKIQSIRRRGKYLLFACTAGTLMVHLGMTGHLRLVAADRRPGKHDLFDLALSSGKVLRLNDTRHFGSVHWTAENPSRHRLLSHLGPEPLTGEFTAEYLYGKTRGRKVAVQRFIMDGAVVAGVGNIYAAESLFRSAILPTAQAGSLSQVQCRYLVQSIKEVLADSIAAGGTGMDFCRDEGRLAYYPQELNVYNREGKPCRSCGTPIVRGRLGNRSTYFCGKCQK